MLKHAGLKMILTVLFSAFGIFQAYAPNLVYVASAYGWACDGTDQSTAALALLSVVSGAGGGTIYFNACTTPYRADSQLFIPNNSGTVPTQVNIRFTGAGGGANWYAGPNSLNNAAPPAITPLASILDLRFHNSDSQSGKIETRGVGALAIDHLQIEDLSSSNATPFIHDTNTVLTIRDNTFVGSGNTGQDAIVLGGSSSSNTGNGVLNAPFQGYGTIIDSNVFTNGNRGVYGRTFANAVRVTNNTFPREGNVGTTAIEFVGNAVALGNYVAGNLIEMDTYKCGIRLTNSYNSTFVGNGFYDPGGITGDYCLISGNTGNVFIAGETEGTGFYDPNADISRQTLIGPFQGSTGSLTQGTTLSSVANITFSTTPTATPSTYACFTSAGQLVSSAAPC
jgi:hypothetical protein